jgi:hypothetical protein
MYRKMLTSMRECMLANAHGPGPLDAFRGGLRIKSDTCYKNVPVDELSKLNLCGCEHHYSVGEV